MLHIFYDRNTQKCSNQNACRQAWTCVFFVQHVRQKSITTLSSILIPALPSIGMPHALLKAQAKNRRIMRGVCQFGHLALIDPINPFTFAQCSSWLYSFISTCTMERKQPSCLCALLQHQHCRTYRHAACSVKQDDGTSNCKLGRRVTPDLEVKQKKKLEVQRPRILSSALPAGNVVLCTIALLLTDRLEATTFKRRLPTQSSFAASA